MRNFFQSTTAKLIAIGLLILMMIIPIMMVKELLFERMTIKNSALNEIYQKWSNKQILQGPILTFPYKYHYVEKTIQTDKNGKEFTKETPKVEIHYVHLLPNTLRVSTDLNHSIRYRGIFEAIVYKSNSTISGTFDKIDLKEHNIKQEDVLYKDAYITFGISDLRGINKLVSINFDGKDFMFQSGVKVSLAGLSPESGIKAPITYDANISEANFHFDIGLNGSEGIYFMPLGKDTIVKLSSDWSHPSFSGDFLPDERNITNNGFSSMWHVVDLNRNYPQSFIDNGYYEATRNNGYIDIPNSAFGVDLHVPVDHYQKSDRSIKYAMLIIILTFVVFFFVEIFNKRKIHPFQYIIVGIALVIFFVLLVAFSEHFGFDLAYIIASIATTVLIFLYSLSIFKNKKFSLMLFAVLGFFYAFIYLLIQLKDYALFIGAIMLFAVISGIMYVSRNIDWYALNLKEEEK